MVDVGAEGLDVLTKLLGNLTVAGQQVLAGHALLTGSTTRRNDVLSVGESFLGVGRGGDVHVVETTLAHLLSHTFG